MFPKRWASTVDAAGRLAPGSAAPTWGCTADALSACFAGGAARPLGAMFYAADFPDVSGAGRWSVRALVAGQVSQTWLRTVTGMLVGAR